MMLANKQKIKDALFTDDQGKPGILMLGTVVDGHFTIRLLVTPYNIDKASESFDFEVINGGWRGRYDAAAEKVVLVGGEDDSISYELILASKKMVGDYNDTIVICNSVLNNQQETIEHYFGLRDERGLQKINDFVAELREAIADAAAEDVAGLAP